MNRRTRLGIRRLASCAFGLLAASLAAQAQPGDITSVSTKFDYVPGDTVLFMDDFSQDEIGEFPARWSLAIGTFEVAEMGGER